MSDNILLTAVWSRTRCAITLVFHHPVLLVVVLVALYGLYTSHIQSCHTRWLGHSSFTPIAPPHTCCLRTFKAPVPTCASSWCVTTVSHYVLIAFLSALFNLLASDLGSYIVDLYLDQNS